MLACAHGGGVLSQQLNTAAGQSRPPLPVPRMKAAQPVFFVPVAVSAQVVPDVVVVLASTGKSLRPLPLSVWEKASATPPGLQASLAAEETLDAVA